MKKLLLLSLILAVSVQSHALVMNGNLTYEECSHERYDADACTMMTTTSLPTLIVDDVTGEEVWNSADEQLLAQYRAELDGSSEIYEIKRYADIKTGGDVELAKTEIRRNLELLENSNGKTK